MRNNTEGHKAKTVPHQLAIAHHGYLVDIVAQLQTIERWRSDASARAVPPIREIAVDYSPPDFGVGPAPCQLRAQDKGISTPDPQQIMRHQGLSQSSGTRTWFSTLKKSEINFGGAIAKL
ncbi:hypothetical protein GCM10011410_24230 [Hoyosella rhizosphaerae]|uniref:Uncharacterized protein n=1 Tax=Hoyosella rhizosphaerae TaxID=1755582 RepID=A0A916UGV1_9ACTN|nr:hypothetical protein GCM10011410_24230 [Hoyosella rhizosphaerae]